MLIRSLSRISDDIIGTMKCSRVRHPAAHVQDPQLGKVPKHEVDSRALENDEHLLKVLGNSGRASISTFMVLVDKGGIPRWWNIGGEVVYDLKICLQYEIMLE